MRKRPLAATFLAAVLAVSLCPTPALAAPLSASEGNVAQTQAGKSGTKTVYVLTKIAERHPDSNYNLKTYDYSYNGKGLLAKEVIDEHVDSEVQSSSISKWAYKGSVIKSVRATGSVIGKYASTTNYTIGKSGVRTRKVFNGSFDEYLDESYSYKNGRVAKASVAHTFRDGEDGKLFTEHFSKVYKYNKKGQLTKITSDYWPRWVKFTYDSNGNLKKVRDSQTSSLSRKYVNTYNKKTGLLKTRTGRSGYYEYGFSRVDSNYTYTYKPIKVKASLVKTVEAQRWALLNDNWNLAVG